MTPEEAALHLGWDAWPDGWQPQEIKRGDALVGFWLIKGNEIHAYRLPQWKGRWLTRGELERISHQILQVHGVMTTRVRCANKQGQQFVERLGFVPVGLQNGCILYKTERLTHARL